MNNGTKPAAGQSKGLEFFFSKQRHGGGGAGSASGAESPQGELDALTDEELARKLQAQYDREATNGAGSESRDGKVGKDENQSGLAEPTVSSSLDAKVLARDAAVEWPEAPGETPKTTLTLQSAAMADDSIVSSMPLDESPLTFEPSRYVPQLRQHWTTQGGSASYALLTRCFVLVSATSSRIKIVDTLVNCLRVLIEGDPSSLLPAVSHLHTIGKRC